MAVKPAPKGGEGYTGHGPAWADPMIDIFQALQDRVEWIVDSYIARSVQAEFKLYWPPWQPTQEQLGRWGVLPGVLGGVIIGKKRPREEQWNLTMEPKAWWARDKRRKGEAEASVQPPAPETSSSSLPLPTSAPTPTPSPPSQLPGSVWDRSTDDREAHNEEANQQKLLDVTEAAAGNTSLFDLFTGDKSKAWPSS